MEDRFGQVRPDFIGTIIHVQFLRNFKYYKVIQIQIIINKMKNKITILLTLPIILMVLSCCRKNGTTTITPQGFQGDVWVFNAVNPILKGLDINPLAKISVRLPQGQGGIQLENLNISIGNTTDLKGIEKIELYGSGSNPDMAAATLVASVSDIKNNMTLTCNNALNAGENFFWLSCKLSPTADVRNVINIQCEKAQLSKFGRIAPKEANTITPKYIGWALRQKGQDNINTYRIPGIATTNKGTLIAVYDNRYDNDRDLPANVDVGMSRSTDGGVTWQPMKVIMDMGTGVNDGIGDPSVLVDKQTGTIWVAALWSHGNRGWSGSGAGIMPDETGQFILVKSEDDGVTWSQPINITPSVKNPSWRLFFQGPGMGISIHDGTLVFPAQYKDADAMPFSTLIYSKNHGQTWQSGTGAKSNTTEAQIVELNDGSLMLNMRDNRGGSRSVATTKDLGQTWTEHATSRSALTEPVCMASIIRVAFTKNGDAKDILAFSNPNDVKERKNMTIKLSLDEGNTWLEKNSLLIDERKCYGYSCMTMIDKDTIGLLYEGSKELYFVRIPLKDVLKD